MGKKKEAHGFENQLELLRKYYPVDDEKRTVDITLGYDSAWDIVAEDVSTEEKPQIKKEIPERMGELIGTVPPEYKVNFNIAISDYAGMKPETLCESLEDAIEMNHFSAKKGNNKKWLIALLLMVAGILFLIFMGTGTVNNWFKINGSEEASSVIVEILDIIAWVFVWESVSMIFLEPGANRALDIRLRARMGSVSFLDKNNKVVASKSHDDLFDVLENESSLGGIGRYMLLFSGSAYLALSIGMLFTTGAYMAKNSDSLGVAAMIILGVAQLIESLILLFAGVGAISHYTGRGHFKKFVPAFVIVISIVIICNIALSIVEKEPHYIISASFSTVIGLVYIIGYVFEKISLIGKSKGDK